MKVRVQYALMTAGLIVAVVLATGFAILKGERRAIEDQARQRHEALAQGVRRIAQESLDSGDRLMLVSYLMFLKNAHPELAMAAVTRAGHTATIGEDGQGLAYLDHQASGRLRPEETASIRLGFSRRLLEEEVAQAARAMAARTAAVAAVFIVLGVAGALTLASLLTRPLTELSAAVEAVAAGNLEVSVAARGKDEVGTLALRFNDMTGKLKELNRFREDVLHTMTHELNTPLSGLKGYLELWQMAGEPADAGQRSAALEAMTAAVARMETSLVGALRLFKAGRGELGPLKDVELGKLAREVCTLFAPVAKAKNITLTLPDGDGPRARADAELLRQIATNLVSNALKYTPKGGSVALTIEETSAEVRLGVRDTGRGISAADQQKLFTKFFRAGSDEDRARVPGTGLGLNIAQKGAEAMGGRITVNSEPGKGSQFTLILQKTQSLAA